MKRGKSSKLLGFKSSTARSRAIAALVKRGFNYFVCYTDKKLKYALQVAQSNSPWVKKQAKNGILIEGA